MPIDDITYHLEQAHYHAREARKALAALNPSHDSAMHHAQIHIAGAAGASERAMWRWQQVVREGGGE